MPYLSCLAENETLPRNPLLCKNMPDSGGRTICEPNRPLENAYISPNAPIRHGETPWKKASRQSIF